MHDQLFRTGQITRDQLYAQAAKIGLDPNLFRGCLDGGSKHLVVAKDHEQGLRAGVEGTPTFFLGGKAGTLIAANEVFRGAVPYRSFGRAIDSVLARQREDASRNRRSATD